MSVSLPDPSPAALETVSSPLDAGRRVLLLGASGTIGRAVLQALLADGHTVICLGRREPPALETAAPAGRLHSLVVDLTQAGEVRQAIETLARAAHRPDVLISCLASRSGTPQDAWAIDHAAQCSVLEAVRGIGVKQVVLLSAICVQKPRLAFQHAKLAFERALIDSGLTYTIVRPTAFFKSLLGQIERVRAGRAYLVFGDGQQTACKPISDRDLARFIVDCLSSAERHNRILPIGGPGPAITPRAQAEALFAALERPIKIRSVPLALMDGIILGLRLGGLVVPALRTKAELARIGRYYATESMLVWDPQRACYDATATPETGSDRLLDAQLRVLRGEDRVERGDHAVF
jgi:divinyl chlorophyllide a 8-vinyl-reductase